MPSAFTKPVAIMQEPKSSDLEYPFCEGSDNPQNSSSQLQYKHPDDCPARPIMTRSDTHDTDAFHIFPMEVDKEHSKNPSTSECRMMGAFFNKDTANRQGLPDLFNDSVVLENWYESTTGPCSTLDRGTPSLARPESTTLVILNEKSLSERNSRGPVEAKSAWKPPRPPKPRFLAHLDVAGFESYENSTPCPMPASRDGPGGHKCLEPRARLSTQGCSRSHNRLTNRSILLQGMDNDISKRQKPWSDPKLGPSRYLSRPAKRGAKSYLTKNDLSQPFPGLWPSIDGLLLRQDSRIAKSSPAKICVRDHSNALSSPQEAQESNLKRIGNWLGKLLSWASHLSKLKERGVISISLVGQRSLQHPHFGFASYEYSVSFKWSNTSGSIAIHQGQEESNLPAASKIVTRLFRADITIPYLAMRLLMGFCTVCRSLMSREVMISFVRLFMRIIGLPVLYFLERLSVSLSIHPRESETTQSARDQHAGF
ncbi:hypothetical protein ABHI18_000653 [Aspergillus niger]